MDLRREMIKVIKSGGVEVAIRQIRIAAVGWMARAMNRQPLDSVAERKVGVRQREGCIKFYGREIAQ